MCLRAFERGLLFDGDCDRRDQPNLAVPTAAGALVSSNEFIRYLKVSRPINVIRCEPPRVWVVGGDWPFNQSCPVDRAMQFEDLEPCISRNIDRKSTRLNSSHVEISYAVFCLKK